MVALSVSPSLVLKDILVTLFSLYKILYPFVVYFGMCVVDVVVVVVLYFPFCFCCSFFLL